MLLVVHFRWSLFNILYYHLPQPACTNQPTISPIWIWQTLKTYPKIQTFLWLACQDRLPCFSQLHSRKIISSPACTICNHQVEDTLHILRDCSIARTFWTQYLPCIITFVPDFNTCISPYD